MGTLPGRGSCCLFCSKFFTEFVRFRSLEDPSSDIECKDSYDSNLDESTFLVTPLSDSNEDEFFSPVDDIELLLHRDSSTPMISVVSILEGFTDEPPLKENDDLFDLESKTNDWKKILYDAPINDLIFDRGGDIDEIDTFINVDISMDIEDGYHDSEGDILYLECLLSDDTTLSLPPKVFLDHDPRSLSDIIDLKIMVKVFNPGSHKKTISPTYVRLPFKDRHYLSFTYVIRTFLPYFNYPVISPFPLSSETRDSHKKQALRGWQPGNGYSRKDKKKAKNDKAKYENEKSVKRRKSQSQSQPRQSQVKAKSIYNFRD
ncbi:hypothetical protein Tco_1385551 [Tanacetum coccineum]